MSSSPVTQPRGKTCFGEKRGFHRLSTTKIVMVTIGLGMTCVRSDGMQEKVSPTGLPDFFWYNIPKQGKFY
jgi:hypothetical protein